MTLSAISSSAVVSTSGRISSVTSSMIRVLYLLVQSSLASRLRGSDRFFGSSDLSDEDYNAEALSAFVRERERWSASGYAEGSPGTGAHPRDVITLLPCVCV